VDEVKKIRDVSIAMRAYARQAEKIAGLRKNPANAPPTLAEAGIDKNPAHEGRKLGALSEKEFERAVTTPETWPNGDGCRPNFGNNRCICGGMGRLFVAILHQ